MSCPVCGRTFNEHEFRVTFSDSEFHGNCLIKKLQSISRQYHSEVRRVGSTELYPGPLDVPETGEYDFEDDKS